MYIGSDPLQQLLCSVPLRAVFNNGSIIPIKVINAGGSSDCWKIGGFSRCSY